MAPDGPWFCFFIPESLPSLQRPSTKVVTHMLLRFSIPRCSILHKLVHICGTIEGALIPHSFCSFAPSFESVPFSI